MMNKKKMITVVGTGYVGMSMAVLLSQKNDVIALDIDQVRVNTINKNESMSQLRMIADDYQINMDELIENEDINRKKLFEE